MGPAIGWDLSVRSTVQAPVREEAEGQCQTGGGPGGGCWHRPGLEGDQYCLSLFLKAHRVHLENQLPPAAQGAAHPAEGRN